MQMPPIPTAPASTPQLCKPLRRQGVHPAYVGHSVDFGYYPNGTYDHSEYGFNTVNASDTSGQVIADFYGNGSAAFQDSVTGGSMTSQGFVTQASGFGRLNNYASGAATQSS